MMRTHNNSNKETKKSTHQGKKKSTPDRRKDNRQHQQQSNHTPVKPKQFIVEESGELLPFLLQHIGQLGRNSVKSILARGQVSVNGKATTLYNFPLVAGHTVSISMNKVEEAPPLIGLRILFEDEHIIVIQKDAGLLSVATAQENELTAYRQLTAYVRQTQPTNRIFVVHRLDRDTSGVMMFAKSEDIQQTLQNSWQDLIQERTYVALVEGQVKKTEGTIRSWLKETKTFKMYSSPYDNGGQLAITNYKMLQSIKGYSLLEVNLETGRKNQIRVHMSDIGHPIVGDKKYGAKAKLLGRLGLHAKILSFEHPATGEKMHFESPIPKTFFHAFKEDSKQ